MLLNLDVNWPILDSVTSVGGTVNIPEVAVTRFFSGGGFSDYVCLFYNLETTTILRLRRCSSINPPIRKRLSTDISHCYQKEHTKVFSTGKSPGLQIRFWFKS